MKENKKICPFMSRPSQEVKAVYIDFGDLLAIKCQEDACALWDKETKTCKMGGQ